MVALSARLKLFLLDIRIPLGFDVFEGVFMGLMVFMFQSYVDEIKLFVGGIGSMLSCVPILPAIYRAVD